MDLNANFTHDLHHGVGTCLEEQSPRVNGMLSKGTKHVRVGILKS